VADIAAHVEVRLWGRRVGALVELTSGPLVFEYAPDFQRSGLEISPVRLPLSLGGPVRFDELRRSKAFEGLPGVLADSLPDAFGNKVIRAYFASRGEESAALSPAQRLLYVGERALGALTYHPAMDVPARQAELEALEIAELVRNARRIVEGAPDVAVPEIYRIGSSAGGMRPKAVVLFNTITKELRSAFAEAHPGDVPSILKFDGVGDGATADRLGEPLPFNRVEAAYNRMAAAAGIDASELQVLHDGGLAHLVVRRFDITESGTRLHQHTLGGILHVDYNDPGASSYEEYLRCILRLGMPYAALREGYRRAAFNVLAVNQDDHVKNLSFHMDEAGQWRLTPAYDLTFAKSRGWTSQHQMRLQDLPAGIRRTHIIALADALGVSRPDHILDQIESAVSSWPTFASEFGVPDEDVRRIQGELEARRREVSS
jgi:serine/threonine-protein kinase HipA